MRDGKEKYELFLRHPNIHPFFKLEGFFQAFILTEWTLPLPVSKSAASFTSRRPIGKISS